MGSHEPHSVTDPVELELELLVVLLELDEVVEVLTAQAGVVDEVLELVVLELVAEVVVEVEYAPSVPHCGTATAEPARARATTAEVNFILTFGLEVLG